MNLMSLDNGTGGAAKVGMSLEPLGSAPAAAPASRLPGAPRWQPGVNVRGFIGRGRGGFGAIQAQTKVVLVNAYIRLDSLPTKDRQVLRKVFRPVLHRNSRSHGFASNMLSALPCIPALTIKNIVRDAQKKRAGQETERARAG